MCQIGINRIMSGVGGKGVGEVGSQAVARFGTMRNDVDDVGDVFSVAQSRMVNKVDMKYGFGVKTDDVCL